MSPREHYSDDRASLHERFDPWSDDQTTTFYESVHLRILRQGKPIRRASASESALMPDFALPEILEEEYLEPQYPTRSATRSAAYPVQRAHPVQHARPVQHAHSVQHAHPVARVHSPQASRAVYPANPYGAQPQPMPQQVRAAARPGAQPQPMSQQVRPAARPALNTRTQVPARPPLRALPPVVSYDEGEEENPFARRSNVGAWVLGTAATVGLFGAVLFGRVLIEAGAIPSAQATARLAAAAAPSLDAPAVTSAESERSGSGSGSSQSEKTTPLPSSDAPAMPSLSPFAAQGASARGDAAPPSSTSKARSRDRRARYERRRITTSDDADATLQRAEAKSRPAKAERSSAEERESAPARHTKNSSSASPLAEERESESTSGIPALLRINSRPWSQIFIDGKLIGNTPQLAIQLPAGKHNVRLVNSEFGMTKTFTLKLAAGESVTRVETLQE